MRLPTFVRTYKGTCVAVLCGGAFLAYQKFWPAAKVQVQAQQKEERVVKASVDAERTLHGQVDEWKKRVETLEGALGDTTKLLKGMKHDLAEAQEARQQDRKSAEVAAAQREQRWREEVERERAERTRLAQVAATATKVPAPKPETRQVVTPPKTPPLLELRTIGSSKDRPKNAPAPLVHHVDTAYLPAACVAKIRLATGVSASSQLGSSGGASWGNPMLYVISETFACARQLDEIGTLTRRQRTGVPLDGCLGLATGKADLASSRVQGEAILLSCVMPGGEAYEVPMKGFLVGQDGKQGIFGTITTHESAKVGKAFLAGIIEEAAAFFSQARRGITVSVGGNSVPYGGMETTLRKVADYWLEQARALQPTLDVEANTTAYLVTLQGVPLDGMHLVNWLKTGML